MRHSIVFLTLIGQSGWNIFVDELVLSDLPKDGIQTNERNLLNWHNWMDPDKHLWIVISGNMNTGVQELVDKSSLPMFEFEEMFLSLRNSGAVTEFVISKKHCKEYCNCIYL